MDIGVGSVEGDGGTGVGKRTVHPGETGRQRSCRDTERDRTGKVVVTFQLYPFRGQGLGQEKFISEVRVSEVSN